MDMSPITRNHRWLRQDLGVYNAHDTEATVVTEEPIRQLLQETGNEAYFDRWFTRFVPVVMAMQSRGFGHLDRDARRTYYRKLRREIREVEREALTLTDIWSQRESDLEHTVAQLRAEALDKYSTRITDAHTWAAQAARRTPDARVRKADEWFAKRAVAIDATEARLRRDLRERRGKFFNMSKELKEVVFDEFALRPAPALLNGKRGAYSLAQDALLYILEHRRKRDEPYVPFIHALCHRSRLRTIAQRYLRFWVDEDDRIYPTIQCASAVTLRLAYQDPALHQWVREIRHLVRARDGHVFIGRDFSQVEGRVFAYESGDRLLVQAFEEYDRACAVHGKNSPEAARWDVHGMNARHRAGLTWDQWMGMPEALRELHRTEAKRFFYRLLYGGDPASEQIATYCPCPRCKDSVPQTLDMSHRERVRAQERWFAAHPDVHAFQENLCRRVRAADMVYTSRFGYRRKFHTPWPECRTQIVNYPMQHGAAQIINAAMERLHWDHGAPIVLQMHDELVLEVPERDAEAWDATLKMEMERPVSEYGGAVFPTSGHIGRNWGELK